MGKFGDFQSRLLSVSFSLLLWESELLFCMKWYIVINQWANNIITIISVIISSFHSFMGCSGIQVTWTIYRPLTCYIVSVWLVEFIFHQELWNFSHMIKIRQEIPEPKFSTFRSLGVHSVLTWVTATCFPLVGTTLTIIFFFKWNVIL